MYKLRILFGVFLLAGIFGLVACNEGAEADDSDNTNNRDNTEVDISEMSDKYVCPMFCEDGKVYDGPGTCPVCEMDMVQVSDLTEEGKEELQRKMDAHGHNHEDDHSHDHEH